MGFVTAHTRLKDFFLTNNLAQHTSWSENVDNNVRHITKDNHEHKLTQKHEMNQQKRKQAVREKEGNLYLLKQPHTSTSWCYLPDVREQCCITKAVSTRDTKESCVSKCSHHKFNIID